MTEEDEAFNEIERRSKAKKDAVTAALENAEIRVTELKKRLDALNASRNDTIEEVAQRIEELPIDTGGYFLAIYIRSMKK